MKRFGSAGWSGNLRNGKGTVSTESRALDSILTPSLAATLKNPAPIPRNYSVRPTLRVLPCRLFVCWE